MRGKTVFIMPVKIREAAEGVKIPDDECHLDMTISTSERDSHHSYMTEKTLRNYGEDAAAGNIPFTNGHKQGGVEHQIGTIFDGSFDASAKRTIATARLLRDTDSTPDAMRVDEYIRRFEKGIYDSVSVEFFGGREICRLCDKDIWDYSSPGACEHIPGRSYPSGTCEYDVDDARLGAVSVVMRGSNPNTKITNLRDWSPELLEAKKINARSESVEEQDGKRWRAELIETCIAEGIRSDAKFDETKWRARLNDWDSKAIQDQTAIFSKMGDDRFGVTDKKTTDGERSVDLEPAELIYPMTW